MAWLLLPILPLPLLCPTHCFPHVPWVWKPRARFSHPFTPPSRSGSNLQGSCPHHASLPGQWSRIMGCAPRWEVAWTQGHGKCKFWDQKGWPAVSSWPGGVHLLLYLPDESGRFWEHVFMTSRPRPAPAADSHLMSCMVWAPGHRLRLPTCLPPASPGQGSGRRVLPTAGKTGVAHTSLLHSSGKWRWPLRARGSDRIQEGEDALCPSTSLRATSPFQSRGHPGPTLNTEPFLPPTLLS